MALVSTRDMFKKAYTGGYAVGAFNVKSPFDSPGFSGRQEIRKA
jgi:hypothetical protein